MNFIYHHEFYHALGFLHEQSRVDTNEHVDIKPENWICGDDNEPSIWDNINYRQLCKEGTSNAQQENGSSCIFEKTPNYSPYDHMSIMHYPGSTSCGDTIMYKVSETIY